MKSILFSFLLLLTSLAGAAQDFSIGVSGAFPIASDGVASIVVADAEAAVVHTVAEAVSGDLLAVTGRKPAIVNAVPSDAMPIIVGTIGVSPFIESLVASGRLDVSDVEGRWEAYGLQVVDNPMDGISKALVIYGSQSRSTAYALFELSRECGVSPWVWWADVTPEPRAQLWATGSRTVGSPSVRFRGIFLNDEDFGLQPWAARKMDTDRNNIGPKTYARIMELMLRLRANTLWPAMHASSAAFWYYKDNIPVAKRYDIYLGSSHCEQMLRDNEWEWNRYGGHYNDDWNWKTNRDMVQRYWEERVAESVGVNGIYTIGMRGVHDSPMNGYASTSERVAALTDIISWQRNLLGRYFGDVTKVPQLFIPYKEVLDCYNAGLQVPDDVMLMWVDDNHGYVRQLPNASEQKRSGGNALYYHLSYWGTPASYLWLSSISPSLCSFELSKCYHQGVDAQWIINVGDIKPAEEELEFCMDLAWDIDSWTPEEAWKYSRHWAARTFGEEFADDFSDIKLGYYRLAAAGKPEHIYLNSYTLEEMDARIAAYDQLESRVEALKSRMPSRLLDAYYELLEYPVKAASQMNRKIFLARKSLLYARNGYGDEALKAAADARKAYRQIVDLTEKYNTGISGGKWEGMMIYHPQNLSTFYMPECASITGISNAVSAMPVSDRRYVDGGAFAESGGGVVAVQGLGIGESTAMVWPETTSAAAPSSAPYAVYDVPVRAGSNTISVRCLPTFPLNSAFDLRVAVSIDGGAYVTKSVKTVATVGTWNQTVAQGYSAADVVFRSDADRDVKVKVAFLDPGVSVSQIAVWSEDAEVNQLTKECIVNYDFELNTSGVENDGTTSRGYPYGWSHTGTLSGNSYGINSDAVNKHGRNVCWMNAFPMPSEFKLYQTIKSDKLGKGTYKVSCRMWMEVDKKANGRLYANSNVQYFGTESDYTNLVKPDEINSYAGYAGMEPSNMMLRDMEVYVTLEDGQDLEIGIKTGNRKNNGVTAADNTGWFKVDYFRIERVEGVNTPAEDLELTKANIVNYDFEQYLSGTTVTENTSGTTRRYTPYGWKISSPFPGTSYGINSDAANPNKVNVCWFLPKEGFMPDKFELYQEIPAGRLTAGRYLVQCKLWVEEGYLATTRLFANDNVQYYGMDTDYAGNLTAGENNTFAGYIGGNTGDFQLQDMYVYVDLAEGEPLRIGIRSSNMRSDGTPHPEYKNGWFKTDYFRISRADVGAGISVSASCSQQQKPRIYNMQGQQVAGIESALPKGVYLVDGRKIIVR